MSKDIELKTFPSTKVQALALLWLKQQGLNGKTPTEIYEMYEKAENEIVEHRREVIAGLYK